MEKSSKTALKAGFYYTIVNWICVCTLCRVIVFLKIKYVFNVILKNFDVEKMLPCIILNYCVYYSRFSQTCEFISKQDIKKALNMKLTVCHLQWPFNVTFPFREKLCLHLNMKLTFNDLWCHISYQEKFSSS